MFCMYTLDWPSLRPKIKKKKKFSKCSYSIVRSTFEGWINRRLGNDVSGPRTNNSSPLAYSPHSYGSSTMRPSFIPRAANGGLKKFMPPEVYPIVFLMSGLTVVIGWRMTHLYLQPDVRAGHQQRDTSRGPKTEEEH